MLNESSAGLSHVELAPNSSSEGSAIPLTSDNSGAFSEISPSRRSIILPQQPLLKSILKPPCTICKIQNIFKQRARKVHFCQYIRIRQFEVDEDDLSERRQLTQYLEENFIHPGQKCTCYDADEKSGESSTDEECESIASSHEPSPMPSVLSCLVNKTKEASIAPSGLGYLVDKTKEEPVAAVVNQPQVASIDGDNSSHEPSPSPSVLGYLVDQTKEEPIAAVVNEPQVATIDGDDYLMFKIEKCKPKK